MGNEEPFSAFMTASALRVLADKFEGYVNATASSVTGDVVLSALNGISFARKEAEKINEKGHTHDAFWRLKE